MTNYYSETAHGETKYDGIAEALRENELAREMLACTEQLTQENGGLSVAKDLLQYTARQPIATASFAEAYERKDLATFDSFANEFRNPSYNKNGATEIVVSLTYVFTKGDENFDEVKALGDAFKESISEENRAARIKEGKRQLEEARAHLAALEKEYEELGGLPK